MEPSDIATTPPTSKEVQQELLLIAVGDRLKAIEADLKSAQDVIKLKNERVLRLEAENIRLKMQRTDKELGIQVDGLRAEVGKKDKENVELRRRIEALQENEAIILRRAAAAEQKVVLMQNTMETIQKSRDKAHLDVERHDRDRLDAVRQMIDAQDRAKKAEAKIAELEGRGKATKPIAKDGNALKLKK